MVSRLKVIGCSIPALVMEASWMTLNQSPSLTLGRILEKKDL